MGNNEKAPKQEGGNSAKAEEGKAEAAPGYHLEIVQRSAGAVVSHEAVAVQNETPSAS